MHEICAMGVRHLSHDLVEPVLRGLTELPIVDVSDGLLKRPLDQPVRCVYVSQQQTRCEAQFGQQCEDVVWRRGHGGVRVFRQLCGEKCV